MAKQRQSEKFTKAMIDAKDGTITEYQPSTTNVYKISDLLERWDGIENVSISIYSDNDIPSEE